MFALSRTTVKGSKQIVAVEFVPSLGADGSPKVSKDRGAGGAIWLVGTVEGSKRTWFAQAAFASYDSIEAARNAIPEAEVWYAAYDAALQDRKAERATKAVAQEPVADVAAQG